jgi:hypothetical protein
VWYGEPNAISNAIGYAKFYSRSHDAVIRVYDAAGDVIETHEHTVISKNGNNGRAKSSAFLTVWACFYTFLILYGSSRFFKMNRARDL